MIQTSEKTFLLVLRGNNFLVNISDVVHLWLAPHNVLAIEMGYIKPHL